MEVRKESGETGQKVVRKQVAWRELEAEPRAPWVTGKRLRKEGLTMSSVSCLSK